MSVESRHCSEGRWRSNRVGRDPTLPRFVGFRVRKLCPDGTFNEVRLAMPLCEMSSWRKSSLSPGTQPSCAPPITSPGSVELFVLHVIVKALVAFIFSRSAEPFFALFVRGAFFCVSIDASVFEFTHKDAVLFKDLRFFPLPVVAPAQGRKGLVGKSNASSFREQTQFPCPEIWHPVDRCHR